MSKNVPLSKLIIDPVPPDNEIANMAVSLQDVGMIHPLQVIPEGNRFKVIAGRTRASAARMLKWKTVQVDVRPAESADDMINAEMVEIDENLFRRITSPAAEALLTARRKLLYERLHPETGHGGDRKSEDRQSGITFTEHQAKMTGRSRRSIQRVAKRAEIGDDLLAKIAGTPLDDGRQLDALIKLPAEKRAEIVDAAIRGERVSATTAVRAETQQDRQQKIIDDLKITNRVEVLLTDDRINTGTIPSLTADNAVLAMWTSGEKVLDAANTMRRLGFAPKGHLIWTRHPQHSEDPWINYEHHVLLLGVRGAVEMPSTREPSLLTGESKNGYPEDLFKVIGRMFKGRSKSQTLDNRHRAGWDHAPAPVQELEAA